MDTTKGIWTPEQVADMMDKLINSSSPDVPTRIPVCPFCKDVMSRVHVEMHDGSGWIHAWQCDCEGHGDYGTGAVS